MKYKVIYNPISGNGTGLKKAEEIRKFFTDDEIEFIDATTISSYSEFFARNDGPAIVCGGDGMLNYIVNELGDTPVPDPLYFYGTGTGNDFLRDIGKKPEDGPVEISKYLKHLPTVTVNGVTKKFINGIGFGIDGYCCEEGDKKRAKSDKPVNYTAIAITGCLFHYKSCNAKVTVDGLQYHFKRAWIVPSMLGRFYGGGMMAAPAQDRLSEKRTLSLMTMYNMGRIKTLMVFSKIFKGEHIKSKHVKVIEGHDITVEFESPRALQIDGETVSNVQSYTVHFA